MNNDTGLERFKKFCEEVELLFSKIISSNKPDPNDIEKAKLGLNYIKTVKFLHAQELSSAIQYAKVLSESQRDIFVRKLSEIPTKYTLVESSVGLYEKSQIKEIFDDRGKLQSHIDDLKDEKRSLEKPKLEKIIQQEYQQKREITK